MTDPTDVSGTELRRRATRSSLYELLGYAVSYALRLVTSTVLRRLLFPAAFGIMEVVTGVSVGLVMLSDVGIRQAVIQSPRGDDQRMLDTAWTMQVIRGLFLWLMSLVMTYPAMLLADEPLLLYVLPVASFVTLFQGFTSTAEMTLRRNMTLGRITALELACQGVAAVTTLTWASLYPSVWALVAGGLASSAVHMVATHRIAYTLGYRNRFVWDSEIRREIMDFGRWITGSSAVHFLSMWTDRLMLVGLVGTTTAGVYATAILISESVSSAAERVLHGVFYPLFSRISREGTERLREVYYRTRIRFDTFTLGGTGVLMTMAPWIIQLLFDDRYKDAGWMLQVLVLRAATNSLITPCETCLTSTGLSRYGFYQNLIRAIWVLITVPIGYALGGVAGMVWMAALSGVPSLMFLWRMFHQQGLLRLEREAWAIGMFAAGALAGKLAVFALPEAAILRQWVKMLFAGG